eukprot:scaffold1150_cov176-Alexandrium_tamarense.AAC.15
MVMHRHNTNNKLINNDNKNNKMSASSTIINNKMSPSTPLRQSCFASPAEANVANRTVLQGILVSNRPEYSRMKAALKSHRVEFVDAKVFRSQTNNLSGDGMSVRALGTTTTGNFWDTRWRLIWITTI